MLLCVNCVKDYLKLWYSVYKIKIFEDSMWK